MKGRKPVPTNIKLLKGTWRADRAVNEACPNSYSGYIPANLKGEAAAFWKRYAPKLKQIGLLTDLDVPMFAGLCDARAYFLQFRELSKTDPRFDRLAGRWFNTYLKLISEFGLTPLSRQRISLPDTDNDGFSEFLE